MTLRMPRAIAIIVVGLVVGLSVTFFPEEHPGMDAPHPSLNQTRPVEPEQTPPPEIGPNDENQNAGLSSIQEHSEPLLSEASEQPSPPLAKPMAQDTEAADAHFILNLDESTHHLIRGVGGTDSATFAFESKRLPSNEVKLAIILKQDQQDDIEMTAYFDLARFTMELDGQGRVLNQEHKQLLRLAGAKLQEDFRAQYEGYDFPEHALMLSQMMSYWSVSPEGYAHEKRAIVSR